MHHKALTYVIAITTILFFHSAGELILGLRSTESKVGETTYFNCSTNLQTSDIFWYHGKNFIYAGSIIYEPYDTRFTIERDESSGSHSLVIHSVKPGDAGEYICRDDDGSGEIRSAQLIVLESDPDCHSNIRRDGIIGQYVFNITPDEVQLKCSVAYHGNIPPQLEWKKVGENSSIKGYVSVTSNVTSRNRFIYTLKFKGDISLDNSSFVCQTTRSTQNQYKCTSETMKVLYFVGGNTSVQHVFRGDNLTCNFSSNLLSCTKQWYYDKMTCPLSCDQTFTPYFVGKYRCEMKCHIRGQDYTVDVLEASVQKEETSPLLTWGEIALLVVNVVILCTICICGTIKRIYPDKSKKGIAIFGFVVLLITLVLPVVLVLQLSRADKKYIEGGGASVSVQVIYLVFYAGLIFIPEIFNSRKRGIYAAGIVLLLVDLPIDLAVLIYAYVKVYKQTAGATAVTICMLVNILVALATLIYFLGKLIILEKRNKDAARRRSVQDKKHGCTVNRCRSMTFCKGTIATAGFIVFFGLIQANQLILLTRTVFKFYQEFPEAAFLVLLIPLIQSVTTFYLYVEHDKRNRAEQKLAEEAPIETLLSKKVFFITDKPGKAHYKVDEEEIELLHDRKNEGTFKEGVIIGAAILNGKLFLVHENSSELEVYDCDTFNLDFKLLTLSSLVAAVDICSCKKNNFLYIMDKKCWGRSKQIIKINTEGKLLKSWSTRNNVEGYLSATAEGNVIITVQAEHKLLEYSLDGKCLRQVKLPGCINPCHSIKRNNVHYIVSHGTLFDFSHRVCLVDTKGNIEKSFGREIGSAKDQLNMPYYLAVESSGCVMVADLCNNRVLLLDSNLEFTASIEPKYKQRFRCPRRVYLDNKRLVVVLTAVDPKETICEDAVDSREETEEGDTSTEMDVWLRKAEDGKIKEVDPFKSIEGDCRILVFDIQPLL